MKAGSQARAAMLLPALRAKVKEKQQGVGAVPQRDPGLSRQLSSWGSRRWQGREGRRGGARGLVGSHRRWKRPCLQTAHMTLRY
jgi:hypothetical protein